jgi:hypothetical protein
MGNDQLRLLPGRNRRQFHLQRQFYPNALAGNVKGNVQINNNAAADVFINTIGGNLSFQGNATINGGDNM